MTFGLASRFNNMNKINQEIQWVQKVFLHKNQEIKDWHISLFFLEDLYVRLDEVQIPTLKNKSESLIQFIKEVNKIQWQNNE
jgi:hypothetical protein